MSARRWTSIMAAALVCLVAAILQESSLHTDDGCAVEIHCLACRLAAGTTGVVEAAALPAVVAAAAGVVASEAVVFVAETRPALRPARGPPLG